MDSEIFPQRNQCPMPPECCRPGKQQPYGGFLDIKRSCLPQSLQSITTRTISLQWVWIKQPKSLPPGRIRFLSWSDFSEIWWKNILWAREEVISFWCESRNFPAFGCLECFLNVFTFPNDVPLLKWNKNWHLPLTVVYLDADRDVDLKLNRCRLFCSFGLCLLCGWALLTRTLV